MENFIRNQYGEQLAILITEIIKICEWITKLEAIICYLYPHLLNIGRKSEFLIFQGS